ncbi:MAG: sodium:proton antiporter [Puniceicoccaceae bacterium]
MVVETAILVGFLFATAIYLILQTSFVRVLFGVVILSNAANLYLLSTSGVPGDRRAPIALDSEVPMMDPIPQALILTAIVIGFGVIAYFVVLLYRIFLDHGTTNAAELFAESSFPEEDQPEEMPQPESKKGGSKQ